MKSDAVSSGVFALPSAASTASPSDLDARLDRIEEAILTMASWLVQAQTGFGEQDARGIEKILRPASTVTPKETER